jgi:hypothetical protein
VPIVELQRRLREAGRIRLGDKGGRNGAPRKLATFRLTGPDRKLLEAAAAVYGGTVEPWPEMDGQFQVTTEATSMDVIIPPTEMAHSVWYEQWSAGGCNRRCDGTWDTITDAACDCDPENRACAPHTRLSVMLTALPGIGVWRLDTQGWNAAAELQGAVDMIQQVAARGTLLPARLILVRRESKARDRNGKVTTRKFVVPALDVDVQMAGGAAIGGSSTVAIAGARGQLEAGPGFTPVPPAVESGPSIAEQAAPREPRPRRANAAAPLKGSGRSRRKESSVPPAESAGEVDEAGPSSSSPEGSGPGPSAERSAEDRERAQRVAMMIADYGLESDEERHRFLLAFSGGRFSSGYDVTPPEMAQMRAALVRMKRGELAIADGADGPILVDTKSGLVPTRPHDEGETE